MKFAIIADLHLHNHKEFGRPVQLELFGKLYTLNSRLVDQILTLHDLFGRLLQKGIKRTFIAGDIFHVRGTIPTDVLQIAINLFQYWTEQGMEFYAISGNHDQMDVGGDIHSTAAFYSLFKMVVAGCNPFTLKFKSGFQIHLLPWIEDRALFKEQVDRVAGRGGVLITHAAIDGAEIGTLEYRLKEPVTIEDMQTDQFAAIFMGHFHKPQKMAENMWYVGSPYQITRAEAGDVKRALVYDTETGKTTQIRTNGKQFYAVSYAEIADQDHICLADGYYDVTLHSKADPAAVRERMAELRVSDFHLIHPRTEGARKSRMKVSKKATDKQILEAFLKAKGVEASESLVFAGLECLAGASTHGSQAKEIIFESVKIRNFLSIGKANLRLHQPGSVIAVLGENLDASGMESNGAGKSSVLPESLVWCLYGTTIRDLPADKVVNSTKKRNCFVKLQLIVDDKTVEVTRYRKHETHTNTLSLVVDGVDLTLGTNALTQAKLDSILGLSLDAFTSILAFSPDSLHFVAATDANKKQILDSIVHTEKYVDACAVAKEKVKFHINLITQQTSHRDTIGGRLGANRSHLQSMVAKQDAAKEAAKETKKIREKQIKDLTQDLESLQSEMSILDKEIQEQQDAVADIRSKVPNMKDLLEAQAKTNVSLREVDTQLTELETRKADASKAITSLNSKVGKECPTCKQSITGEHVGRVSAKLDKSITLLKAQIGPLEVQKQNLLEVLADYNLRLRKGESKRSELDAALRKLESKQGAKRTLDNRIRDLQGDIKELQMEPPVVDYAEDIAKVKGYIKADKKLLEEVLEAIQQSTEQKDIYSQWVAWFGNKGIKSFLLDRIVPDLTQYANEFADQLTDGDITIEFETNSDGNDKFTIAAYNSEGADLYGGNSSGERRRIDICVMFALFRLANEQTNINVLLLDEVFDTVDVTGLERIVTMIHNMARELDLTIFVTSHTDLRKWLHESVIVSKQNRIATLKGSGVGA